MYGALLLFESEFVHIVAISFTALILTELLMVALTVQTWHWLMIVAELLSLACYVASLVFLHEFIGESRHPPPLPSPPHGSPASACLCVHPGWLIPSFRNIPCGNPMSAGVRFNDSRRVLWNARLFR